MRKWKYREKECFAQAHVFDNSQSQVLWISCRLSFLGSKRAVLPSPRILLGPSTQPATLIHPLPDVEERSMTTELHLLQVIRTMLGDIFKAGTHNKWGCYQYHCWMGSWLPNIQFSVRSHFYGWLYSLGPSGTSSLPNILSLWISLDLVKKIEPL